MNKRTIGSALGAASLIAASALAVLTATPASATNDKCEVIKHENLDGVTTDGKGSAELTHWGLGLETKYKHDSAQWGYDLKPPKKLDDLRELSYKAWTKDHGPLPNVRLGVKGHKKWEQLVLVFQPGKHFGKSGDAEKGGHGTYLRATDDDAQWLVLKVHDKWGDDDDKAKADVDAAAAEDGLDAKALNDSNKPYVVSWKHLSHYLDHWYITSIALGLGPWAEHGDATVNEFTVNFGYKGCDKHYWKKPKYTKPTESPSPTPTETKTEPAAPPVPGTGGGDEGPSLPVTGAGVAGLSIAGLVLLAGGGLFMMFTRRRRFEA